MSIQVQHRKDSRANCEGATPAVGELWWDTTLNALRAGTGALLGGLLQKRWGYSHAVSPTQITSDQNNYNPTDLAIAETLYLTTDAARTLTGLSGGASGARKTIVNRGGYDITLASQNVSSTAANRFLFEADVVIRPSGSMELQYSATDSRWMRATGGTKFTTIPQELLLTGSISPAQITGNQNNYAPSGVTLASTLRLNTDASRDITGLVDPRDGCEKTIINVGSNAIVLKNADAGSTAANRFDFGGDLTLSAKQSCRIRYDGTDSRWKLLASTAGSAVSDAAVSAVKLGTSAFGMHTGMLNGAIVESRASNAVTFAIKTLAGTDPSSIDPVRAVFQNGSGGYVVRDITAALSLTISSGSTMGFTSAAAGRLWLLLIDTGAGVVLGAVNCLSGINVLGLHEGVEISTTAEGGAGAADNAHEIYSAASQSSKFMCFAGYADYDSGLATAGTWASAPTRIVLHGPGVPRPGDRFNPQIAFFRTLSTTNTSIPGDNTTPQNNEGDQFLSLPFRPTAKQNLIDLSANISTSNGVGNVCIALFQDSAAGAIATSFGGAATSTAWTSPLRHRMRSDTVAQTTFKLRAGGAGGTTTINGIGGSAYYNATLASCLEAHEIMG